MNMKEKTKILKPLTKNVCLEVKFTLRFLSWRKM